MTLGPFGRTGKVDLELSGKGFSPTITIAYSKGAYLGAQIAGAVVGARHAANSTFYGKPTEECTPLMIMGGKVEIPTDKETKLADVHEKLNKLVENAEKEAAEKEAAAAEETK